MVYLNWINDTQQIEVDGVVAHSIDGTINAADMLHTVTVPYTSSTMLKISTNNVVSIASVTVRPQI